MPNDVLTDGGARLRAVRKERGYTQEHLAELTKLSTRHIASIEKGEANPSFEVLYTIITALPLTQSSIRRMNRWNVKSRKSAGFTGPARNRGGGWSWLLSALWQMS